MRTRIGAVFIAALLLFAGGAVVAAENPAYSISMNSSVDVPNKTVTLEGTEYNVSRSGMVAPGDDIVVNTETPDEMYTVYLYNSDEQIVAESDKKYSSGTVSFETDELSSGSYIVAITGPQGDYETIYPVVIRGYDVSLSASNSITEGETTDVAVNISAREDAPEIDTVEVVIADGSETRTVTATKDGDQYVAPISIDSPGSYELYANVRGTESYQNQKELLATTSPTSLTVNEASESDTGGSSSDSDSDSSGSQGSSDEDSSTTTTDSSTATTESPSTSTVSPTAAATTTAESTSDVITPNESTTSSDTTSSDGSTNTTTPGFSAVLAVFALLVSIGGFGLTRR